MCLLNTKSVIMKSAERVQDSSPPAELKLNLALHFAAPDVVFHFLLLAVFCYCLSLVTENFYGVRNVSVAFSPLYPHHFLRFHCLKSTGEMAGKRSTREQPDRACKRQRKNYNLRSMFGYRTDTISEVTVTPVRKTPKAPTPPVASVQRSRRSEPECLTCGEGMIDGSASDLLRSPTKKCKHQLHTCSTCMQHWIRSQLEDKNWDTLTCPECSEHLKHDDVRKWADEETFER